MYIPRLYLYCTLRGRDQRLKCVIISIFYGAVLYLPNFRKIQHTWVNIARLGKYSTLGKKLVSVAIWSILLLNSEQIFGLA